MIQVILRLFILIKIKNPTELLVDFRTNLKIYSK